MFSERFALSLNLIFWKEAQGEGVPWAQMTVSDFLVLDMSHRVSPQSVSLGLCLSWGQVVRDGWWDQTPHGFGLWEGSLTGLANSACVLLIFRIYVIESDRPPF